MDRRHFLKSSAALAVTFAAPARLAAQATDPNAALYDAILQAMLQAAPQTATGLGLDGGANAGLKRRLDDRTPAGRLNLYQPLADMAPRLAAARTADDPRQRQWLETARWYADAARRMAAFPYVSVSGYNYPVPYAVSQLSGAYVDVPDFLASQHTIETAADCEAYVARLEALGPAIDANTAMNAANAGAGVVPPDFICDRALTQLSALRRDGGAKAGLVRALADRARAKGIAGDWEARATALVDGPIAQALDRQIAHMQDLRRRARPVAGVRDLPQGDAYYAMAFRFQTTTERTPQEVHQTGLDQVKRIHAEADALMKGQGRSTGSVVDRMNALSKDPSQLFPNTDAGRDALLAFVRERTADVKRRMPAVFSRMPRTPMEVRRVPLATELGAPGAYSQSGSIDGTRPGAIYFNLSSTANWPKWALPSTVYHEGFPGHHFQGALANETPGTPELMKVLGPSAYAEGWGLYAEELADELGVYDADPINRLGRLHQSLFRACRLVVDTGMHALGWTREQAIAFMVEQGGQTPDDSRREVERYCVWPGQACSYKIGHLEFMRVRAEARQRMGARFDIRGFHDTVLLGGGMPLSVMAALVEDWSGRRA